MFSFSKKKKQIEIVQPQQPNLVPSAAPPQPIKEAENPAEYQIPDFTEEDLNFDLGLGEFTPEYAHPAPQDTNNQMAPTSAPETNLSQNQNLQTSKTSKEEDMIPSANDLSMYEQAEKQFKDNETIRKMPKAEEHSVDEDTEIPKFDVSNDFNLGNIHSESKKELSKKEKPKKERITELEKEIMATAQIKKDAAVPSRSIFMSSEIYDKTVILTEDTLKKAVYGESVKSKFSAISESKKQQVDELSKLTRSILDSLLNCDAKLFEKGDEK
jgi:hypothetical protein